MTVELRTFIQDYGPLSAEVEEAFAGKFQRRTVPKGQLLLRPGEVCQELLFLQTGCLRTYLLAPDGSEVSVWFAFPRYLCSEITSFISGQPSEYAVEAIADCEVLYLPKHLLSSLYDQHPALHGLMRQVWEYVILNVVRRFTALQHDTAEQRYRDLLQQPNYMQLIPQKYLASFIGVTPSSFSRIRKKLASPH